MSEMQERVGSSTLNRALDVLEVLAADRNSGLTAAEIAQATGINRVTVHRILNTFRAHGFVRQGALGDPYRLGFRFVELSEYVLGELDLVAAAQPILQELVDDIGETAHLAVLDEGEAVYVAKVESSQSMRLVSRIGRRVPLYCTALGKALLAWSDPSMLDTLLAAQSFESRTARTFARRDDLLEELARTRERGWAIDHAENEAGVHCVAAPVLDRHGRPVAAVSTSGPDSRIPEERFDELGERVAGAAKHVASALGAAR